MRCIGLRDTLLRAAESGLYEVRWSATTLDEVEQTLRNRLLANHPDRAARVEHLLAAIRAAFSLATVAEEETVIARLTNFDTTGEFSTSAPLHDHDTETIDRGTVRTRLVHRTTNHNEFASGINFLDFGPFQMPLAK